MSLTRALTRIAVATLVAASALPAVALGSTSQIAGLRKDVAAAGRAYEKARWRLEESEMRAAKTDRDIAATDKRLAEAKSRLSERVGIMYRTSSSLGYLDVILGSDSYMDMVTRIDFVNRIGRHDANALAEVEALQASLAKQRAQLAQETKEKTRSLASLRSERDRLRKQLAAKQAAYDRIAKSGGASPVAPKGSLGMVFPVRGVYYYSDTWGASRGGGRRRHKGTDIMAARGTPVVAVRSGTITSKSGGIGGKVIWLRADNGWSFYYAHLDGWAVRSGRVSRGQVIGYVGDTGNASGGAPHLHFEMQPPGSGSINPYPYLRACE